MDCCEAFPNDPPHKPVDASLERLTSFAMRFVERTSPVSTCLSGGARLVMWPSMKTKSTTVPKIMLEKYEEITQLTNDFCSRYLNEEYAELIRYAVAAVCRKHSSPLAKGKPEVWACGFVHALGVANFLFDKSQSPHMLASEIYAAFNVSTGTGQAKSKTIRDLLSMTQADPDWCVPSMMDQNPLIWMLSIDGYIIDIRRLPREIQSQAFAKGLIPYIPADRLPPTSPPCA